MTRSWMCLGLLAVGLASGSWADDGSYAALRARFETPPNEAKLRTWFHWLGDCVTEEGLRADLDAMKRIGLGGFTIVNASMWSPSTNNAPVMSAEWKRLVKIAGDEARSAGMEVGQHNCPGWTSSGGPWILPENAMKCVTGSCLDVTDADGEVRLPQPHAKLGFYRDLRVFAFPVPPAPVPESLTASFACETAAVLQGVASVPLRAWPEDAPCSFVFDFGRPVAPRALEVAFDDRTHVAISGELAQSADGRNFTKVRDMSWRVYHNEGATQTTIFSAPSSRWFRVTFRDRPRGVWFRQRDPFHLKRLAFASLPVLTDAPGAVYAFRPRDAATRGAIPAIPTERFVDLTSGLAADGTLRLDRPFPGAWRFLRIGYTLTGRRNSPARLSGLECDKLSPRGIDSHWEGYVKPLLALDGAPTELLIDSYEVGSQTWTEGFDAEFRRRRGYDLTPYLPALVGYVVDSHDATDRFLFDFARTVAQAMAENYYSRFAAKCRAAGVRSAVEPYCGPFDGFAAGRDFDVPVGEFWLNQSEDLVRTATSLAHLYGRKFAAAESFSARRENGRWSLTPRQLKAATDRAWLWGINRLTVHSYVHQPHLDRWPGVSLGFFGSHFNRNVPWWDESVAWCRYVARGQSLLSAGHACADVLIFRDETNERGVPDVPALDAAGFDYDYAGADITAGLSVRNGEVVFPSAPHGYRLLQLGGAHWTLGTLRKVRGLLEEGANVAGPRPEGSPSLADDADEVRSLIAEIWGSAKDGEVRSVGNGRLACTKDTARALAGLGLIAPFRAPAPLRAVSRQTGDTRIWFVANPSANAVRARADFATGPAIRTAELWNAMDGTRRRVAAERTASGRMALDLELPPHGSIFAVFSPSGTAAPAEPPTWREVGTETGAWQVTFSGLAAPQGVFVFDRLVSWTARPEPEIVAFAGRATYVADFALKATETGARYALDLGDVRDVARVRVNGREAGIAWTPPYRVDMTGLVKKGGNRLEITVANNWPNRLIADARAKAKGGRPVAWSNYDDAWKPSDEPLPAGLLGPVRVLAGADGCE